MRTELGAVERGQIQALAKHGASISAIARIIGRNRSTVRRSLSGSTPSKRPGRPKKVSTRDHRRILREASSGTQSSTDIKDTLDLLVTARHVRRIFSSSGMFEDVKQKKNRLLPKHKKERVEWAKANVDLGLGWSSVIFTDEKSSIWMVQMDVKNTGMIFAVKMRNSSAVNKEGPC